MEPDVLNKFQEYLGTLCIDKPARGTRVLCDKTSDWFPIMEFYTMAEANRYIRFLRETLSGMDGNPDIIQHCSKLIDDLESQL